MSSDRTNPRHRLALKLNAGISVTFFVAVLFNLAQAVVGDEGTWPVEQPWLGLRVIVGVLFLILVVARIVLWITSKQAARRNLHQER